MYNEDPVTGKRIYTLKKVLDGVVTKSAHPARFSPDDKYSRYATVRLTCCGWFMLTDYTGIESHWRSGMACF